MKIPSSEFYFKLGMCYSAAQSLKSHMNMISNEMGEESFKSIDFLIETLTEMAETAYDLDKSSNTEKIELREKKNVTKGF